MLVQSRALHFVLKVANLMQNVEFFRDMLGMTVLRHEVFEKGCDAACNGPYDGKWSKTMIGYGSEDDHFVLELTYNYSIGSYQVGNDLQHITLDLTDDIFQKLQATKKVVNNRIHLTSPDGYKFIASKLQGCNTKADITEVCLACKDLEYSIKYWSGILKMSKCGDASNKEAILRYSPNQAALRLRQIEDQVDHKTAYGRIAFSCPTDDLKSLQKSVEDAKQKVLTPYLSLDTPGKATVHVVILADPDGHEICFVGDEAFRELSQVDPNANELIEKSIAEDKSDEWFRKKGIEKVKS